MKEKRRYRKYDEPFKNEVLDQVRSRRSVKEIAEGLGLTPSLIYQWKSKSEGGPSAQKEDHEVKQLRKRAKELEKDADGRQPTT